ncbi:MAG: MBL fold metallo-hydrolase [Thermodesulfobacteriota bacterium]|jgi:glyoxylase-like metal-dependent hydrolase (beta-lactamase superfamily II)
MIVKQIPTGAWDVFSYIIGDEKTGEAMVIDPGGDVNFIVAKAKEENLNIKYIFNTHSHGDHTSGNAALKKLTSAKIVMHALEDDLIKGAAKADIRLKDEKTFKLGEITFQVFHTPGHSPGGLCLYAEGQLFTGDTLFVGDSGRTDLAGGNRPALGASIRRLMELSEDTIVWPGHDYGPTTSSTLGREKRTNVNAKEYGYYMKD